MCTHPAPNLCLPSFWYKIVNSCIISQYLQLKIIYYNNSLENNSLDTQLASPGKYNINLPRDVGWLGWLTPWLPFFVYLAPTVLSLWLLAMLYERNRVFYRRKIMVHQCKVWIPAAAPWAARPLFILSTDARKSLRSVLLLPLPAPLENRRLPGPLSDFLDAENSCFFESNCFDQKADFFIYP